MKKLLQKMGWIDYRGRLNKSEIAIDVLTLSLIAIAIYIYWLSL